nr:immunoglobulin light chain junction region [Macaca mulatta]
CLRYNSVPPTF